MEHVTWSFALKKPRLMPSIIVSLVIAALSYFWGTALMDSLFAFRSPLHEDPPQAGRSLGEPLTRRVVLVLIDALRADTAADAGVMPSLAELRRGGASSTMHSQPPSYSAPGYSVLFTGAWPDVSDGPALNPDFDDIPVWTQDDLFSAAHRSGLKTAVSGYNYFEKLIPQAAVDASFYTAGEDAAADREVLDAALSWLKSGDYQLVLIHIDQVDYAGHHEGGPRDPRWNEAASRSDALLQEIATHLDLTQDTLLVFSDHGQIDMGGHGGHDPVTLIEPFVAAGSGILPGKYPDIQMVDLAPTVAALLGTNIPASAQGRILTGMLRLTPGQIQTMNEIQSYQQVNLANAYTAAIGSPVILEPLETDVDSAQAVMNEAQGFPVDIRKDTPLPSCLPPVRVHRLSTLEKLEPQFPVDVHRRDRLRSFISPPLRGHRRVDLLPQFHHQRGRPDQLHRRHRTCIACDSMVGVIHLPRSLQNGTAPRGCAYL